MEEPKENRWQGLNAVSGLFAALALPIVLAMIGNRYTNALKEREIQGRFVELALSILKEPPKPESRGVRGWAIGVINQYSGVPLSQEAREDLKAGAIIASQSRVYLLAGGQSHAGRIDSLRTMLLAQGVDVIGQNASLQDETRPKTPEVRYFFDQTALMRKRSLPESGSGFTTRRSSRSYTRIEASDPVT